MSIGAVMDSRVLLDTRVIVRAQYLDMAQLFTKRSDDHEWSAGISIEPHHGGGATIVASDGSTIAAWHDAVGHCTQATWIKLPRTVSKALTIPATDRKANVGRWFFISATSDNHWLASVRKGPLFKTGVRPVPSRSYSRLSWDEVYASELVDRVDVVFPPWRSLFPTEFINTESVALPAALLERFAHVRPDDIDNPSVTFSGVGPKQVLVSVAGFEEFIGLAVRRSATTTVPAWLRQPPSLSYDTAPTAQT
jgi:hypothetical protein